MTSNCGVSGDRGFVDKVFVRRIAMKGSNALHDDDNVRRTIAG
jgi:hypothetical protein